MSRRHTVRCQVEHWLPYAAMPKRVRVRASVAGDEFEPEWRLVHMTFCLCSVCGGAVRDAEVLQFWDGPASHDGNVCQECM